jgi:hypothetical protein
VQVQIQSTSEALYSCHRPCLRTRLDSQACSLDKENADDSVKNGKHFTHHFSLGRKQKTQLEGYTHRTGEPHYLPYANFPHLRDVLISWLTNLGKCFPLRPNSA